MKYTALLLDDEERGRNGLGKLISDYCPTISLIGACASGEEAFDQICKLRPSILFLDIEIAQAGSEFTNSFQLLAKLPKYNFEIVFVTAHEHYALQALRSHAVGYVLKPISISELVVATDEAILKLSSQVPVGRTMDLVNHVQNNGLFAEKLWIHSQQDILPINISDITRLEADGKYTNIHCVDGTRVTSSKNLGEYSGMLDQHLFLKVHRSHIVNVNHIVKFSKSDGGFLISKDGASIPVSRNGKDRLLTRLSQ
jgi:two-component system, LytTR family, response regulator